MLVKVMAWNANEGLARFGSLTTRLVGMANGGVLRRPEAMGFEDTDPSHRSTMPTILPIVPLDHILVNHDMAVQQHNVHAAHEVSDHRAISATVVV